MNQALFMNCLDFSPPPPPPEDQNTIFFPDFCLGFLSIFLSACLSFCVQNLLDLASTTVYLATCVRFYENIIPNKMLCQGLLFTPSLASEVNDYIQTFSLLFSLFNLLISSFFIFYRYQGPHWESNVAALAFIYY